MIERRYDNRTVQGLLGHASVEMTQIYTHVLNKGGRGVRSPIDEEWVGALYGFSIFALRLNLLRTSLFDSVEG